MDAAYSVVGRSRYACNRRAYVIGVRRRASCQPWTPAQDALLREAYSTQDRWLRASIINDLATEREISTSSVLTRACNLRLRTKCYGARGNSWLPAHNSRLQKIYALTDYDQFRGALAALASNLSVTVASLVVRASVLGYRRASKGTSTSCLRHQQKKSRRTQSPAGPTKPIFT